MLAAFVALAAHPLLADESKTTIPMWEKGRATYYVRGAIQGMGEVDLMVDTGSGYLVINEQALEVLAENEQVRYLRELRGVLADGTTLVVPVYSVNAVNIGGGCWLHDIEAAVFPGRTRFILGLSALTKASPFVFSVAPPELKLSNCRGAPTLAGNLP